MSLRALALLMNTVYPQLFFKRAKVEKNAWNYALIQGVYAKEANSQ
jgi:hypothetical protein